jgi:putative transposase
MFERMKIGQTSCDNNLNDLTKIITVIMKVASHIIQKSFKFRICEPSKTVQTNLEQTLNLCRDLYNCALQERRDAYKLNRISLNYYDQANQLKEIKQTNPEYRQIHSQVLQDVLKRLDKTLKAFFQRAKQGKAGFPRFKGQNRYDSFCFPQRGFSLTGNRLALSKIGTVKLKLSRQIIGKVKTLTIKNECGKWFAIFTVETAGEPLPKTGKQIGIDAGIANFLTLSDGMEIKNNRFCQSTQKKLRRAQRSVSRKKKGSNSHKKAVLKVRKIHHEIKNRRNDYQHKVSMWLIKNYDNMCIEKLNLSGMVKSNLGKSLNDVAIGNFYNMLRYKAVNAGKKLIEVPARYTSQTCYECGHCEKANRKTQADFECVKCNHKSNADWNAAKNILRSGIERLALSLPLGEFAKESPVF